MSFHFPYQSIQLTLNHIRSVCLQHFSKLSLVLHIILRRTDFCFLNYKIYLFNSCKIFKTFVLHTILQLSKYLLFKREGVSQPHYHSRVRTIRLDRAENHPRVYNTIGNLFFAIFPMMWLLMFTLTTQNTSFAFDVNCVSPARCLIWEVIIKTIQLKKTHKMTIMPVFRFNLVMYVSPFDEPSSCTEKGSI